MRELLAKLRRALNEQRPFVHCSIVETRGSTPQKAGASMLVFGDGSQCGTLGGGCVEAEVKQRALRVLAQNQTGPAELFSFNLDDNYGWDDGLICGGRMSIVAEPHATEATANRRQATAQYYGQLQHRIELGLGCTEAILIASETEKGKVGARYLFDSEGTLIDQLADGPPAEALRAALKQVRERPRAYTAAGVAFLPQWPRITALIVGGGHVGLAVAKLAADVDFDVWVLDDREAFASKDRFPMAERTIIGDIGASLAELVKDDIDGSTFGLIITRGHNHDEEALYHLATSKAGYVGMIGSKRKIKLIFEDLISRGIPKEALERVHAPLGFSIGSRTVPEIAVSIVAELIACRNLGGTIPAARIKVQP